MQTPSTFSYFCCHASHSRSLLQYQCNWGPWNIILYHAQYHSIWQFDRGISRSILMSQRCKFYIFEWAQWKLAHLPVVDQCKENTPDLEYGASAFDPNLHHIYVCAPKSNRGWVASLGFALGVTRISLWSNERALRLKGYSLRTLILFTRWILRRFSGGIILKGCFIWTMIFLPDLFNSMGIRRITRDITMALWEDSDLMRCLQKSIQIFVFMQASIISSITTAAIHSPLSQVAAVKSFICSHG